MKITAFILLVCIIAASACKKEGPAHIYINADLKTHFNYKPGSYWIYRDSLTGQEDSFFVLTNEFQTQSMTKDQDLVDDILIYIRERSISPGYADSSAWAVYLSDNKWNLIWGRNDPASSYPNISYPFTNQNNTVIINILSNYTCSANTFNNVAKMYLPIGYTQYNDWFYVTDSVGVIKMRINHPLDTLYHVWEIERWNVIK